MRVMLFSAMVVLALGGCAARQVYKPAGDSGLGYRESQVAENRYRIQFTMRGDERFRAVDYALLRAAELTLMADYDWFVVVDRHSALDQSRSPQAGVSQERRIERTCGLLGCTASPSRSTRYGLSAEAASRRSTEAIVEIRLGKGVRPEGEETYDARTVRTNLRKRSHDG